MPVRFNFFNYFLKIIISESLLTFPNRWIDTEFLYWNFNKIILGNVRKNLIPLIFIK